jgi:hypothetical protein
MSINARCAGKCAFATSPPNILERCNATNQMTDLVKIECPPEFAIDQIAYERRYAPFLGRRAPS